MIIKVLLSLSLALSTFSLSADSLESIRLKNAETITLELTSESRNLELMNDLFTEDLKYIDPMTTVEGRENVKQYFSNLNDISPYFTAEVRDIISKGDTYVVIWKAKVSYKIPSQKASPILDYEGTTVLKFAPDSAKAYYHRDYYDHSEVMEYMPIIGRPVRFLHKQMVKMLRKGIDD